MKTLFIEARKKNLKLGEEAKKFISSANNFSILYSIQYKSLAEQFKKEAERQKKKVLCLQQVLGCSNPKLEKSTIVLIGSGRFHAVNLASRLKQPIYIISQDKIDRITEEEIKKLEARKKAALIKLYSSKELVIIISTKPGQNKQKQAFILKNKLEKQGKKVYLFLADNINLAELENFSLPIYINTACPGLFLDSSKIINLEDITL